MPARRSMEVISSALKSRRAIPSGSSLPWLTTAIAAPSTTRAAPFQRSVIWSMPLLMPMTVVITAIAASSGTSG